MARQVKKQSDKQTALLFKALDGFKIELPSWGFADTGTRFGKFYQDAAASTPEEKFHDAGLVHKLTGACPTVAVHTLWDFPADRSPAEIAKLARKNGVKIGAINPNVFQDQVYKFGSFCSPDSKARKMAIQHTLDSISIAKEVGSTHIAMWLADGTNYPGQDNIIRRKRDMEAGFKQIHKALSPKQTLLVEYKPFEPAFYHTDIADWGMAYLLAKAAGPRAKVLVDTGHHLPGCNIEHIVAVLLDEGMLGGFHFNDRKYADDDLTLSSIDPYAVFRIFDQILQHQFDTGKKTDIAYMIDQSHNLKPKLEAMVQTVEEAQKLYAKAALVDRKALATAQKKRDIVGAERILRDAYESDVRDLLRDWRLENDLPAEPLEELRTSGIIQKLGQERAAARKARGESQGGSYA